MKVVFTIDSLAQGGTEQSLAELISYFSKNLDIVVVYFYDSHQLKDTYENLNCKLYFLDINEKYGFYDAVLKFKNIVKLEKPDIVISSLYRSLIISRFVCLWTSTPLIGTFVNERYSIERKSRFKGAAVLKYYLIWLLDRLTSFIPKKFISNSYSISTLNGKALNIPSNKIKVIYRGRDSSKYKPWEIPSFLNHFVWIAVGRLIPQKGYENLLLAFHLLKQKKPYIKLVIIGEGHLRIELQKLIHKLNLEFDVSLKGNIPLGWKNIYDSHAFVLPSISEGFSGALIEALFTGIPIVLSDIPMNLEAVSPGRKALIFRHNDWLDLYNKMYLLMDNYNQYCNVGKLMRSRAIYNYNIQSVADIYEKTIESVINE